MQNHYFISETDGSLHDTRDPNWSSNPLRPNYRRHHSRISSIADLKATLRAGPYAWPGGYPLYFITNDGAALSFDSARTEFSLIARSIEDNNNDGWRIVACDINYEDDSLYCDHTGDKIESAYGDD
jgi:hypothetical protein